MQTTVGSEPKRIRALRESLVAQIPRVPNNRATKAEIESKPLHQLLLIYLTWAARHVPARPREVALSTSLITDSRWSTLQPQIEALLSDVTSGSDLSPYLSIRHSAKGYSKNSFKSSYETWEDKDQILQTMGYCHFHLTKRELGRTDEVLFARISRNRFEALLISNHSVFKSSSNRTAALNAEASRLWKFFTEDRLQQHAPGQLVFLTNIAVTGHSIEHIELAQKYTRMIQEMDSKLDDPLVVQLLFGVQNLNEAKTIRPKWAFNFLDLGLINETTAIFHPYQLGPI